MSANDPFYRHEDELALLGCLLDGDQPTANDILDAVRAEKLTHQLVIDALAVARSLAADGANIDAVTVGGRWAKVHGRNPNMADLSDALGKCIVASNWTLHPGRRDPPKPARCRPKPVQCSRGPHAGHR